MMGEKYFSRKTYSPAKKRLAAKTVQFYRQKKRPESPVRNS